MIHYKAPTSLDIIEELLPKILTEGFSPVRYQGDRVYLYDVLLEATAPKNNLEFSTVLRGEARWKKFCRDYLDMHKLRDWIDEACESKKGAGINAERGFEFEHNSMSAGHQMHGNCLWGLSFHLEPEPHLTLLSRVSALVPVGWLDMSLLNLLSFEFAQRLSTPVTWSWFITQMQLSFRKSLPLWMSHGWYGLPNLAHKPAQSMRRTRERYLALESGEVEGYAYKAEERVYTQFIKQQQGLLPAYYAQFPEEFYAAR